MWTPALREAMNSLPSWAKKVTVEEIVGIAEVAEEYAAGEVALPTLDAKLSELHVASAAMSLRALAGEVAEAPECALARARLASAAARLAAAASLASAAARLAADQGQDAASEFALALAALQQFAA